MFLSESEKTIRALAQQCADAGQQTASRLVSAGQFEPLYLYYKQSTELDNGKLLLVADSEKAPLGFKLATGEGLRGNVPYSNYYEWVKSRVSRLPILAYGK